MADITTILSIMLTLFLVVVFGIAIYFIVKFFKNPLGLPAYKEIGQSCVRDSDCKNWGYGIGGTGVTCCPQILDKPDSGICTAKKDLIRGGLTCKYPPNTWLAAGDVPYAYELCLSGKSKHGKGLDILCA